MTARRPAHTRRDQAYAPLQYRDIDWRDLAAVFGQAVFIVVFGWILLSLVLVVAAAMGAVPA